MMNDRVCNINVTRKSYKNDDGNEYYTYDLSLVPFKNNGKKDIYKASIVYQDHNRMFYNYMCENDIQLTKINEFRIG